MEVGEQLAVGIALLQAVGQFEREGGLADPSGTVDGDYGRRGRVEDRHGPAGARALTRMRRYVIGQAGKLPRGGRGRRLGRAASVGAEDLGVERRQARVGIEPGLLGQHPLDVLIGGQRLVDPPGGGQRRHEDAERLLGQRVVREHRLGAVTGGVVVPLVECQPRFPESGLVDLALQAGRLAVEEGIVLPFGEGDAADEQERRFQGGPFAVRVAFAAAALGFGAQVPEPVEVGRCPVQ
ncbi:hypothetical protein GCM10029992_48250 [Glycomyces albus]